MKSWRSPSAWTPKAKENAAAERSRIANTSTARDTRLSVTRFDGEPAGMRGMVSNEKRAEGHGRTAAQRSIITTAPRTAKTIRTSNCRMAR